MSLFAVVALFVSILVGSTLTAYEPTLTNITPAGFQRGKEVEVTFSGSRLGDFQEVLFYSPGVSLVSFDAGKDKEASVVAKLNVAADCRLGIHAIRLRTATGVSNLMTFTVGLFEQVAEVEPNTDFAKPQPIPMNCTISGVVATEDVDNFVVELKKGDRLSAEVEGMRLGRTLFDPYLAILNEERFELMRSDDASLLNQDCVCSIVAPEDGKYIIQIRETSYGGGGAVYRLHVGNFPRPVAVYPAGGKPGETIQVKWIGDAGGEFPGQLTLPTNVPQNFGVHAQDAKGMSPSPNMIRVNSLNNALEAEPNDELAQAAVAGDAPLALNGIIEKPGDIDYFKFNAKKGQQFDIRVSARKELRSPLDSVLTVVNEKGASLGSNDDTGGPDSYVRLNVPADGVYGVSIRDHLKSGGPAFVYRIEITPVEQSVTIQLPERVQYVPTTLSIPKGNRMALMVSAVRTNWSGDFVLEPKDLPPGVTCEVAPMAANRNETILLFSAAADAKPAGKLATIGGKPTDTNLNVADRFHHRTMLVRGNNNVDVWGHSAERFPVVLTDGAPFKLEIVQPKVPIVRNGNMDLKVVATRAPDFKAPISVALLYNPPGIGSSASAVIAEGQNEAVIPLTCGASNELKSWKIAVTGRAPFGNSTVECSSQLADLNVADQFHNFTFDKAACEIGREAELVVKVEKKSDFEGEAKAELLGLPADATAAPVTFKKDTEELVFTVKVGANAKAGKYSQIVCRSTFQLNGEPVTMTQGNAELRVDTPLPPKSAVAGQTAPAAGSPAAKPADAKRLSRLEQLRLEKEQAAGKK